MSTRLKKVTLDRVPEFADANTMYVFPPRKFSQRVYDERTNRNPPFFFPGLQQRIQKSRIVFVGLGGIGSPTAEAVYRLGAGTVVLVDSGLVDVTNIHRQFMAKIGTVGKSKALEMARELREIIPDVEIIVFTQGSNPETVYQIFEGADLAIDAIEYHHMGARYEALEVAEELHIPVMNGNSVGYGTRQFYWPNGKNGQTTPSFKEAWPFDRKFAYDLENKLVAGTDTKAEYDFLCSAMNLVFLDGIPNYGSASYDTRALFLERLATERIASIVSTNPKFGAGILGNNITFFFAEEFGVYENVKPLLQFPYFLYADIGERIMETRKLNLKKINDELARNLPC
jgi:hypothetical protein